MGRADQEEFSDAVEAVLHDCADVAGGITCTDMEMVKR